MTTQRNWPSSPRLADIGGARLWRIDRKADYGQFNALATGSINVGLIRENWSDLIRLAGSLKLGHLKAAGVMRTLQCCATLMTRHSGVPSSRN